MAGCVLPFLVNVFLMTIASKSRVKFRGKWTQMIERFFMSSHRSAERPFVKRWTVRGLMT